MTLVKKTIKGKAYYYFQDSVKLDGIYKVINTCVCRADVSQHKLAEEKHSALAIHLPKIFKLMSTTWKDQYKFNFFADSIDIDFYNNVLALQSFIFTHLKKLPDPQELEDFEKILFIKYVYGTTAIEGNTLTEIEASRLLVSNLTPKNKTINEIFEVGNYNHIKKYMNEYSGNITEKMILQIHKLLMTGICGYDGKLINAGEYRTSRAILLEIEHTPSPPEMISSQLKLLVAEYTSKLKDGIHPFEAASYFHQKFEEIHPFQDGNGRVGRELLNYMLVKEGFPPIYITPENRTEYLNSLVQGNTDKYIPLFTFLLTRMGATFSYFFTKTNLYSLFKNDNMRKIMNDMIGEEISKTILAELEETSKKIKLP